MAVVDGVDKVTAALRAKAKAAGKNVVGIVGFTAAYALPVHERLDVKHPVGQAKYLEQPAREMRGELGKIIKEALRQGKTMGQAILLACLRLQRESQLLCPVLTGNLKGSAFTRLDEA